MAIDLVPRRLFSFPSIAAPDFWEDDDAWLTQPTSPSGLSVYEDDQNVYVDAAVPGIDPNDVEITFQDGYLWIRGEVKEEEKDKKSKFYRKATQSFSYRVAVPGEVDANKEPDASYKRGVMTVKFTKAPKAQPKKIKVKTVSE